MSVAPDVGRKHRMKTAALGCITYLAIAGFVFGSSLLKPVFLATIRSDRSGRASLALDRIRLLQGRSDQLFDTGWVFDRSRPHFCSGGAGGLSTLSRSLCG